MTTSKPPTNAELAHLLGRAHAAYEALTDRPGATAEWKRYSKEGPWVLKVSAGKRTLFYVKPDRGSFEVTVLLGERATKAALGGRVSKGLHASIQGAGMRRRTAGPRRRQEQTRSGGVRELIDVKLNPE
jgi:hypothetical protein